MNLREKSDNRVPEAPARRMPRKKFRFKYRRLNRNVHVDVLSENMNNAMIFFSAKYVEVTEVYSVKEI